MSRREFDRDFKIAAVKLVTDDEMDVKTVSERLDVHPNSLYRWIAEYEKYGKEAFPGKGTRVYDFQAEIYRLNKKNRELEEELNLLKQFRVFLKRKSK